MATQTAIKGILERIEYEANNNSISEKESTERIVHLVNILKITQNKYIAKVALEKWYEELLKAFPAKSKQSSKKKP